MNNSVNASRSLSFPVRSNDQVKAGLGAIGFPDLGKLVGAGVIECVNPEAVSKFRDLENDGFFVKGKKNRGRKPRPDLGR